MLRTLVLGLAAAAGLAAAVPTAEAQTRRTVTVDPDTTGSVITVRPRSFLNPGNVVPQGSMSNYATSGVVSYLNNPPYMQHKDRFGEGALPDPVQNGPFVGARNPFGPVDYMAPGGLR